MRDTIDEQEQYVCVHVCACVCVCEESGNATEKVPTICLQQKSKHIAYIFDWTTDERNQLKVKSERIDTHYCIRHTLTCIQIRTII